jgi:hypothetical protein
METIIITSTEENVFSVIGKNKKIKNKNVLDVMSYIIGKRQEDYMTLVDNNVTADRIIYALRERNIILPDIVRGFKNGNYYYVLIKYFDVDEKEKSVSIYNLENFEELLNFEELEYNQKKINAFLKRRRHKKSSYISYVRDDLRYKIKNFSNRLHDSIYFSEKTAEKFLIDEKLFKDAIDYARNSYFGGVLFLNEKYKKKIIKQKIARYDLNSSYSYAMKQALPQIANIATLSSLITKANKVDLKLEKFQLVKLIVNNLKLKRDGVTIFPNFVAADDKKNSGVHKYSDINIDNAGFVYLTNYDISDIRDNYIFDYTIVDIIEMPMQRIDPLANAFENTFKQRDKHKKYKQLLAKMIGKFSNNEEFIGSTYYFDNETGVLEFSPKIEENEIRNNQLIATFVTSYARYYINNFIREFIAKNGIDKLVYSDTDSLHVVMDDDTDISMLPISGKLGDFKIEYETDESYYSSFRYYLQYQFENNFDNTISDVQVKLSGVKDDGRKQIVDFITKNGGLKFETIGGTESVTSLNINYFQKEFVREKDGVHERFINYTFEG